MQNNIIDSSNTYGALAMVEIDERSRDNNCPIHATLLLLLSKLLVALVVSIKIDSLENYEATRAHYRYY